MKDGLQFPDAIQVHKRGTMNAQKSPRVQPFFELRIASYFEVPVEVIFATAPFPRLGSANAGAAAPAAGDRGA